MLLLPSLDAHPGFIGLSVTIMGLLNLAGHLMARRQQSMERNSLLLASESRLNMFLVLMGFFLTTACERVPIVEARLQGEGLVVLDDAQDPDKAPRFWYIEDDWHRLFLAVSPGRGQLHFYVRSHDDPSASDPAKWWAEGAHPLLLDASTSCESSVQYFDNPNNSFLNNFSKSHYPEIYPFSPETEAPGFAVILEAKDCIGQDIDMLVSVLDESGEHAREHRLTLWLERVDWDYYIAIP